MTVLAAKPTPRAPATPPTTVLTAQVIGPPKVPIQAPADAPAYAPPVAPEKHFLRKPSRIFQKACPLHFVILKSCHCVSFVLKALQLMFLEKNNTIVTAIRILFLC